MLHLLAILLYVVLWASGFIPSRILLREVSPLWALVVRLAIAGGLLVVVAAAARLPFPRTRREWRAAVTIGLLTNVVYLALLYVALRHLSAGMAAILASTNPLFLTLGAPWLLGERVTPTKAIGMALGFGGVAFVMVARRGAADAAPAAVALALVAVLGLVGTTVVYKRASLPPRAVAAVTGVQLLVGSLALLPLALAFEGPAVIPHSADGWLSMGYLVLVMSVGASLLWFWLLTHGEATRVSAFYFLVPLVGLVLAHLTLGEPLTARDLLGAVGIAVGIALVHRSGAPARRLRGVAEPAVSR